MMERADRIERRHDERFRRDLQIAIIGNVLSAVLIFLLLKHGRRLGWI